MPLLNTIIICPESHSVGSSGSTPSAKFVEEFVSKVPNATIALALETCGDAICDIAGDRQTLYEILSKYMSNKASVQEVQLLRKVADYYMPIIDKAKQSSTGVIFADSTNAGHKYTTTTYIYNPTLDQFDRQDTGDSSLIKVEQDLAQLQDAIRQEVVASFAPEEVLAYEKYEQIGQKYLKNMRYNKLKKEYPNVVAGIDKIDNMSSDPRYVDVERELNRVGRINAGNEQMFDSCRSAMKDTGPVLLICGVAHAEGIQNLAKQHNISGLVIDLPDQQNAVKNLIQKCAKITPSDLESQVNSHEHGRSDSTVTKHIDSNSRIASLARIPKKAVKHEKAAEITNEDQEVSFNHVHKLLAEADDHTKNLSELSRDPLVSTGQIEGLERVHRLLDEADEHTANLENILKGTGIRAGLSNLECSGDESNISSANIHNGKGSGKGKGIE